MSKRPMIALLITLLLALTGSIASAEIYSWRDANGHMHYSDQPPPDAKLPVSKAANKASGELRYVLSVDSSAPAAQSGPQAKPAAATSATSRSTSPGGPKTTEEKDAEYKQRKAAEQQAEAEKAYAEQLRNYCDQMRQNISLLESDRIVSKPGANGESNRLDPAQRQQELQQARDQVAKNCK